MGNLSSMIVQVTEMEDEGFVVRVQNATHTRNFVHYAAIRFD